VSPTGQFGDDPTEVLVDFKGGLDDGATNRKLVVHDRRGRLVTTCLDAEY